MLKTHPAYHIKYALGSKMLALINLYTFLRNP